jgi:hypothetical protein
MCYYYARIMRNYEIPKPESITALPVDELNYLDINSINALRLAQDVFLSKSADEALANLTDRYDIPASRLELANSMAESYTLIDTLTKDYLLQYIDETDPKFDEYYAKLRQFSIDNMTSDELANGKKDVDGNRIVDTEGWRGLLSYRTAEISALTPSEPADDDTDPEDPELLTPNPFTEIIRDLLDKNVEASEALKNAREALARAEVEFRSRRWFSGHKRRKALVELRDAYNTANVEAAKSHFELEKTRAEEYGKPMDSQELNQMALVLFSEEFKKYAELQSEESYLTDFGKKCRALGSVPLKERLWRMSRNKAAVVGFGVLAVATGGIGAIFAVGAASTIGVIQTRNSGTFGHGKTEKSKETTDKVIKKTVANTEIAIRENKSVDNDDLAKLVSESTSGVSDRIHSSNRRRRTILGVSMGAAVLGGVFKAYSGWENGSAIFGYIKPKRPHRVPTGISKSVRPTGDYVPPVKPPTATPPSIPDALKPTQQLTDLGMDTGGKNSADYATYYENQRNFFRILSTPGEHPWNRAVGVFNGDTDTASDWLRSAATKAGAHWHGSGVNAYIQLANGETDTDSVWNALVAAANS